MDIGFSTRSDGYIVGAGEAWHSALGNPVKAFFHKALNIGNDAVT